MSSASPWGLAGVYQNQLCLGSGICAPLCPFQKEPGVSSRLGPDCLGSSGMRYLNCSLSGTERGGEHSPFWTPLCQGTSHVGKQAPGTEDQLGIPYLNSGAGEWSPCCSWQALFFLPPVLSSFLTLFVFQVHLNPQRQKQGSSPSLPLLSLELAFLQVGLPQVAKHHLGVHGNAGMVSSGIWVEGRINALGTVGRSQRYMKCRSSQSVGPLPTQLSH